MSDPNAANAPRILLVDDEPSIRQFLAYRLKREGFDVLLAGHGREAIALLDSGGVDLLFSDILMPDIHAAALYRADERLVPDIFAAMITACSS